MTTKISAAQVVEIFQDVPGTIRKLASENKDLRGKVAAFELRERTTKIANDMHRKNINAEVPLDELIEHLEKQAAEGKLDVIEQAVAFRAPDMGEKIGQLDERGASGSSDLERFIVGGVG